ncbi:MAG: S-layer homology domain-containing protein [Candidatus Gracilibacteria bacterium]|jgi:hypothetical protein|nr:S-layer homology domain-containing protein [Candidatus Gracilibacteria bacterium]
MKKILTKIAITTLSLFLLAQSTLAITPLSGFSDTTNHTYSEGINYLKINGLINGYSDGTFKPDNTINRAEMIKILVNGYLTYNNLPQSDLDPFATKSCFNDIPANEWFTKYVCFAKEKGWVKGYENGTLYRPNQLVPFVEGLKMTLKSFQIDFTEGDPWYKDAVEKASEKNFIPFTIHGFSDNISRGEMSDLIVRIIKDKEGSLNEYLKERGEIQVNFDSISQGVDFSNAVTMNTYKKTMQIFMIKTDDAGKNGMEIGCSDSVVPIELYMDAKLAGDYIDDIETALNYLLNIKTSEYTSPTNEIYYNSLHSSDLIVTQVLYDDFNNSIEVNLSGELNMGGVCDNPRIEAQLEQTIHQFGDFDDVTITIDYEGLDELLSLQ